MLYSVTFISAPDHDGWRSRYTFVVSADSKESAVKTTLEERSRDLAGTMLEHVSEWGGSTVLLSANRSR